MVGRIRGGRLQQPLDEQADRARLRVDHALGIRVARPADAAVGCSGTVMGGWQCGSGRRGGGESGDACEQRPGLGGYCARRARPWRPPQRAPRSATRGPCVARGAAGGLGTYFRGSKSGAAAGNAALPCSWAAIRGSGRQRAVACPLLRVRSRVAIVGGTQRPHGARFSADSRVLGYPVPNHPC
jgi:hypothetical protein